MAGKIVLPLFVLSMIAVPMMVRAGDSVLVVDPIPETFSQYNAALHDQSGATVPVTDSTGAAAANTTAAAAQAKAATADTKAAATSGEPTVTGLITEPFNFLVLSLAGIVNYLASGVGWMILTLIKLILIPILNYDGFATSRIIGLGWSLVRDVVNMFVVVILLVIAVMTIVGSPKANWEQQIPRLFIYVIAVNFSRTICGLLLDVGNVVMFQFVNAILDVGAGNFAQLLKLTVIGSFSKLSGDALLAPQLLASAYIQLALLLAVLAVIGLMVAVFIYRIVVLWVLIIMSPAAFFMGGIKDVLGQAGSAYGEWWKKFSSAIILGPMLTFFLWLALAAASSGDIVASENFPTGGTTETTPGLVLKSFDMTQLTGLFLGLVLLVVGMQQAAQAAGSLGGVASQFINEGMGMRIVKGALRMPAQQFGRQLDRRLASPLAGDKSFMGEVGKQMLNVGQGIRSAAPKAMPGLGHIFGATVGKGFSIAGSAVQGVGTDMQHEAQHNSEERVKNWSTERLVSELTLASEGRGSALLSSKDSQGAAIKRLVTDKSVQGKLEIALNDDAKFQEAMRKSIATAESHDGHLLGPDGGGQAFHDTKTKFVHLLGALEGDSAIKRQKGHIEAEKTNIRNIGDEALKDEGIRSILNSIEKEDKEGHVISKLDEIRAGNYGEKAKAAVSGKPNPSAALPDERYDGPVRGKALAIDSREDVQVAVSGSSIPLEHGAPGALRPEDFAGNSTTVTHEVGTGTAKHTEPMPVGQVLARGIAFSGKDLTLESNEMDPAARDQFDMHINSYINNENTVINDRKKAIAARFLVNRNEPTQVGLVFNGSHPGEEREALRDIVKADPAVLSTFATAAAGDDQLQEAIERAVSQGVMSQIKANKKHLSRESDEYKKMLRSVNIMRNCIEQVARRAALQPGGLPNNLRDKKRDINALFDELS